MRAQVRRWLLGVLAVPGVLSSCKNDLDQIAAVELPVALPDRVTTDAEYLYSDSGVVRNRLRAGTIAEWTGPGRRTELTDGLELLFFDVNGMQTSRLTARKGIIEEKERRMEVLEDVVFVNQKGERLETERLLWVQDSARIRTDQAVRIQRGQDVILAWASMPPRTSARM
ncbi:MAG: LPS export ABC transporter periplasmic protein LptC [Flavobacteriales bacterium]|nr:LPS export ABC transporter periplasmic protein LptC [Flavobacteriales bacterium]